MVEYNAEHVRTWRGYVGDLVTGDMAVLYLYDLNQTKAPNHHAMGYTFMHGTEIIFSGDDFGVPVSIPVDSDQAVRNLLGFLSLRPGDTDSEHFDSYTQRQVEWAEQYGEDLSLYAQDDSELTEEED